VVSLLRDSTTGYWLAPLAGLRGERFFAAEDAAIFRFRPHFQPDPYGLGASGGLVGLTIFTLRQTFSE
jgi:hypothetical protein